MNTTLERLDMSFSIVFLKVLYILRHKILTYMHGALSNLSVLPFIALMVSAEESMIEVYPLNHRDCPNKDVKHHQVHA